MVFLHATKAQRKPDKRSRPLCCFLFLGRGGGVFLVVCAWCTDWVAHDNGQEELKNKSCVNDVTLRAASIPRFCGFYFVYSYLFFLISNFFNSPISHFSSAWAAHTTCKFLFASLVGKKTAQSPSLSGEGGNGSSLRRCYTEAHPSHRLHAFVCRYFLSITGTYRPVTVPKGRDSSMYLF